MHELILPHSSARLTEPRTFQTLLGSAACFAFHLGAPVPGSAGTWISPPIDAQVTTPHTAAMGAEEWPRARFLEALAELVAQPTRRGSWASEPGLEPEPGGALNPASTGRNRRAPGSP